MFVALTLLACFCAAPCADAHEWWLTLSDYAPHYGEPLEVRAYSGVGFRGELKRWNPDRCLEFSWQTYRRFTLAPLARLDDSVWAKPTFFDRDGAWVQYQSNDANITLPAAEFDAYLADAGLYEPLAARRRLHAPVAGRELYRRCAKAWITGKSIERASRPVGQPLELVPQTIPGDGAQLRVRVLWQGKPLAGAIVKSWRQPLTAEGRSRGPAERDSVARVETQRTDPLGRAAFDVRQTGEWLLSVVHMVPSADTSAADWQSTWASMTFARRDSSATTPH